MTVARTPEARPAEATLAGWRPPRAGSVPWWRTKARQFRTHLFARVAPSERAALESWLSPRQLALFDRMHVADRRHGLDVVATLRSHGATDRDLLLAGLLHDAGKGRVGVRARIAWSLGEAFGRWVLRLSARRFGLAADLATLEAHAERSAVLAAEAGCPRRTVALIRAQDDPGDDLGRLLLYADEAN